MDRSITCSCLCILAVTLLASGCESPYHADRGALLGGLGGAGVGALVGHAAGNTAAGAVIGAGVGALSGAAIGAGMDEVEAKNRAQIEAQLGRQVAAGAVTVNDVSHESGQGKRRTDRQSRSRPRHGGPASDPRPDPAPAAGGERSGDRRHAGTSPRAERNGDCPAASATGDCRGVPLRPAVLVRTASPSSRTAPPAGRPLGHLGWRLTAGPRPLRKHGRRHWLRCRNATDGCGFLLFARHPVDTFAVGRIVYVRRNGLLSAAARATTEGSEDVFESAPWCSPHAVVASTRACGPNRGRNWILDGDRPGHRFGAGPGRGRRARARAAQPFGGRGRRC